MLPTPEQCWLSDTEGYRYVSELRLIAVDRFRVLVPSLRAACRQGSLTTYGSQTYLGTHMLQA